MPCRVISARTVIPSHLSPTIGVVATIPRLLISGDGFWSQDIFDAAQAQ